MNTFNAMIRTLCLIIFLILSIYQVEAPLGASTQPKGIYLTMLASDFEQKNGQLIQFDLLNEEFQVQYSFPDEWTVSSAYRSPDLSTIAVILGDQVEQNVTIGTEICVIRLNDEGHQCWDLPLASVFQNGLKPAAISWDESSNFLYVLTYFPDKENPTYLKVATIDVSMNSVTYTEPFTLDLSYATDSINLIAWNPRHQILALWLYKSTYAAGETAIYTVDFATETNVEIFKSGHIELFGWEQEQNFVQFLHYSDISSEFELLEARFENPSQEIVLANVPSTGETYITPIHEAIWLPNDGFFVYIRTKYDEDRFLKNDELLVWDTKIEELETLFTASEGALIHQLAWIPDNSSIAVVVCEDEECNLHVWRLPDQTHKSIDLPYKKYVLVQ